MDKEWADSLASEMLLEMANAKGSQSIRDIVADYLDIAFNAGWDERDG